MKFIKILFFATVGFVIFTSCSENVTDSTEQQNQNVIIPKVEAIETNLIQNSDMEDGKNFFWAGSNASANYSLTYTDEESNSSTHSLMVQSNGAEEKKFAYWAQTLKLPDVASKKLTASVSIKFSDVNGSGVALAVRGDDTEAPSGAAEVFTSTQGRIVKTGSGDWQTLEVSLDDISDDIKSITIYMLLSSQNGTVYFDDLSLTSEEGHGPSYTLQNTSFESGSSYPYFWWDGATKRSNFNLELVSTKFLSSTHSVKISSDNSSNEFSFWAQTFNADKVIGKSLQLYVNIRAEEITGEGIAIAIRGDDRDGNKISAEIFSTTQNKEKISD